MDIEQQRINVVASNSNSSSLVSSKRYDVFLSFRGKDTRDNFTSHLYDALTRGKIETFIDEGLEKGDEISPALIKAIEDSRISVVIFSKNYASSKWCLNELNKIMEIKKEKGQIVIPVFYKVDPSHVRHQIGSYQEAFAKHEGQSMCNKWKVSLTEAANLSGWDYSQYRTESELVKDIVHDVFQKLPPTYSNKCKSLVGIEKCYKEIESLLKLGSSEVITLGIWGMGGMGKTSIAETLYYNLSYHFEGRCFLANVREKSGNLDALCKELLSNLFGNKHHGFDSFNMSRLPCKKVFIVLDDVSAPKQLEKLFEDYNFLGAGSRVIVTTRDKQILSTFNEIYPIKGLTSNHSLELFCKTVFGGKEPEQGYEDISRRVISYCSCVPLALKVLGASLRNRSKEAWECELSKLEMIPNNEIHNVLKISYDSLDNSQKNIFLDIACFLKGKKRDRVIEMLESFGFFATSGIEALLDKTLITISHDNKIEMHDLIEEMGQKIVHQESESCPEKQSRLWKCEKVLDVLKYNKGTDAVEAIILDLKKLNEDLNVRSDSLAKMTNVRFLKIHDDFSSAKFTVCLRNGLDSFFAKFNVCLPNGLDSFSDKLRYLHWSKCCLESLPPNFCAEHLVELHMPSSNLKKLWDGLQNLVNLKTVNLSWSKYLIEIPDLSMAKKLEEVKLEYCGNLRQLHPSMLSLSKLTYLHLCGCNMIVSLKSDVPSKSLYVLDVKNCWLLKEFSLISDKIKKLDFSTTALCALSPSIGHLLSLEKLNLSSTKVQSLPPDIINLSRLTKLQLKDCEKLVSLPKLPPLLTELDLDNCQNLVSLLELSPSLTKLNLCNCRKLVFLPELPGSLRELSLQYCQKLVSLPQLPPSVMELNLNHCKKLVSLSELPPSLTMLDLGNCREIMFLPKLPSSLVALYIDDCQKLMSLPELPPSVKYMMACNCISLETEITRGLVLQHMSQSCIPTKHNGDLDYFIIPGDHVIENCGFHHATENSITISHISKFDLFGFIFYISFWEDDLDVSDHDGQEEDDVSDDDGRIDDVLIYINQDGIDLIEEDILLQGPRKLIADHVLFSYVDISRFGGTSEVYDQFSNITFEFELKYQEMMIKGCGVFPVYETTSGLKLVNKNTVGHDQERIKGCGVFPVSSSSSSLGLGDENEAHVRAIGVGGSNNENEDGCNKQLPTSKRQRTSP